MGALKGTISYSKFYVRGELPDDFRDRFVERVRLRAFRPLTVEEEDEVRIGWCAIANPLDCDLDYDKMFFNSYLNLGLRTDRWQIPSPLFKAHFGEAERDHLAKHRRDKLSRREKEDLSSRISRKLRAQLMPAMKTVDLAWNLETSVVRFWSQSPRSHEALTELFADTFEFELVPESPFTAAARLGLSPAHEGVFETLKPSAFHSPPP